MIQKCYFLKMYLMFKLRLHVYITFLILTLAVVEMSSSILTANSGRNGRYTYYDRASSNYFRRSVDGNADTYAFGYEVEDPKSGNNQFRSEQRYPNGTVVGTYGYLDSHGKPMHFRYVADGKGYRVRTVRRQRQFTLGKK